MSRFLFVTLLLLSPGAHAQVQLDARLPSSASVVLLEDLSINDSALFYSSFCFKNGGVLVPGWTRPADLANSTSSARGIILKLQVLPGHRLKATYVDAAQAQNKAKGNPSAPQVLSKEQYTQEILADVRSIYSEGPWGTLSCDEERHQDPLRHVNPFTIESINGYETLSELLASLRQSTETR